MTKPRAIKTARSGRRPPASFDGRDDDTIGVSYCSSKAPPLPQSGEHQETAVTRVDLVEAGVQEKSRSVAIGVSARLVKLVFQEITNCLERGETVKLSSFGSFVVRSKGQRKGRNPKTGEEVPIAPHRVMVFRPSATLRGRLRPPVNDEYL